MNDQLHRVKILFLVIAPLLGTIAAVWLSWNRYVFPFDMVLLFLGYLVTTIGVTIGFHRMLTHQGFSAPAWLRGFILILGSMALEGSPDTWAATHIKHHAHSDEEGDPHSPLDGFWHAHMGWLFSRANFPNVKTYAPHLLEDPVVRFVSRYHPLWIALTFIIPFVLGGWTGLVWGGFVRIFLGTHMTWSVNSVCHSFGKRDFATTDESRNEWIIGLFGFGEGWHNNHHAFPRSAFHGLRWWQFDLSGIVIRALEAVGLVWNVQRISPDVIAQERAKAQEKATILQGFQEQLLGAIRRADHDLRELLASRFSASSISAQLDDSVTTCEEAVRRLEEIRAAALRSSHMKKQRAIRYLSEVQRLVEQVKAMRQPIQG